MIDIVVGRADWRNAEHLWKLRCGYMKEEAERDPSFMIRTPDQAARVAHQTQEWLFSPTAIVVMAYQGEVPLGYMVFEGGDFIGFHSDIGLKVTGFYVDHPYRHGVAGQKLLRAGYELVRQNGYPRTQAVVMAGNDLMRNQLERQGYRLVAAVYERLETRHGFTDIRTEAEREIHPTSGGLAGSRAARDVVEPAVPGGSTTCDGVCEESQHIQSRTDCPNEGYGLRSVDVGAAASATASI